MTQDSTYTSCSLKADPTLFARISRLMAGRHPLDDVLQSILAEAVWATDAIRGFLAIADHECGELVPRYTSGEGWTDDRRAARLKISEKTGRGITSHVAATAIPYRTDDVTNDPYYIASFDDVRSEIAVPLIDSFHRVRGVMNIESINHAAFNQGHECTLVGLADLAVIAISMNELERREAALLQVSREISGVTDIDGILAKVNDVAAEVLNFEDCSIFLKDEVSGKLVLRSSRGNLKNQIAEAAYDYGEGLTGWTAKAGAPVRVVDPTQDSRWRGRHQELPSSLVGAFMAVPIYSYIGVVGVLRVQRKKSSYRWFPNAFSEDDEGILVSIAGQLGIALDNAKLIEQLVKAERFAAWGELSARSAHMIGNRVFAIKGDINELDYRLAELGSDGNTCTELSDSIKKNIYLLEEILNEFRDFVKATHLDLGEADINKVVQETLDESFPKRSGIKLIVNLTEALPRLLIDAKKLKRSFSELVENSVSFLNDSGEIRVSTSIADEESKRWLKPSFRTSHYVLIRLEDTGPGVEPENKTKIFNPFYTSRAKGMGLGLSIVRGVVDSHDGFLFEDGKVGTGARFNIFLPITQFDSAAQ